jgi:hypothetical protein
MPLSCVNALRNVAAIRNLIVPPRVPALQPLLGYRMPLARERQALIIRPVRMVLNHWRVFDKAVEDSHQSFNAIRHG